MGKRPRPCPCGDHKNELVPASTWSRHTQEIALGKRSRWEPSGSDEIVHKVPVPQPALPATDRTSTVVKYSTEVTELVGRGVVNVTGAEAMLKIQHSYYSTYLPVEINMPKSWYRAKNHAVSGREPVCLMKDYCVHCDHLFSEELTDTQCPDCTDKDDKPVPHTRFDPQGKPIRRAYFFEMADKIRRLFSHRVTAKALGYGHAYRPSPGPVENRELKDCWDGTILQVSDTCCVHNSFVYYVCHPLFRIQWSLLHIPSYICMSSVIPYTMVFTTYDISCYVYTQLLYCTCAQDLLRTIDEDQRARCLFLALSYDGVEVEKNVSYTPITGKILNFPPKIRGSPLPACLFSSLCSYYLVSVPRDHFLQHLQACWSPSFSSATCRPK